jgi:triosephosphate isomerase
MQKIFIVANWKMNPQSFKKAKKLFDSIKRGIKNNNVEVVICPPFIFLPLLKTNGAQDCFWEGRGAYTGEISPLMLKKLGVKYVIVGHSERRKYFKETNEMINKKLKAALKIGLNPILCVDKISQIPKGAKNLIIAYEPLFAIGTGKSCSWKKAKEMKNKIQKVLSKDVKILYGGSVNSQNASDYIEQAGFQGLLIGNASLDAKEFIKIWKKF